MLGTGGDVIDRYVKKRLKYLEKQILKTKTYLKQFKEGTLICSRNGKHFKWYQTDGTNQIYIPKANRELAEHLAVKKYLLAELNDMENEEKACQAYLNKYKEKRCQELLMRPGYAELLKSHFETPESDLFRWANEPYERNHSHPEHLIHKCAAGCFVRSKSEAMIATSLYTRKIPFRYECGLYLNGTLVYPDFTIRHPDSGQLYYWEHFGLMDKASYVKDTMDKMLDYCMNGIIPSIHLITTYETKEHPLSIVEVDEIVEKYFG